MPTTAQRSQLAALMDWLHDHRAQVHYPPIVNGQIIRQQTVHDLTSVAKLKAQVLGHGGAVWDCSQTCYALLLAVGLKVRFPDGATGSMLDDLPHYSDARQSYIGALAVFGPHPGHHVVMVRHRDTHHGNPVCLSHGGDPLGFTNLLTEASFQPAPVTMLSIAHL